MNVKARFYSIEFLRTEPSPDIVFVLLSPGASIAGAPQHWQLWAALRYSFFLKAISADEMQETSRITPEHGFDFH